MPKFDATHLFVAPTLASIAFSVVGSGSLLLLLNLPFITQSGLINDLVLGESRSSSLQEIADTTVIQVSALTLENEILNTISFFMFWMLVGLAVFLSLSSLGHTLSSITETIETTRYLNQRKKLLLENLYMRMTVRSTGILGLAVFYVFLAKFILPFALLANQAWLGHLYSLEGWLYGVLGFIVLALSLHIITVFARLAMLKPRLFGGWDSLV